MQVAGLDTLAVNDLIDRERWKHGEVVATNALIPAPLASRVEEANASDHELVEFLCVLANEYELTGPSGLKDRTGLMEHRQDAL